MTYLQYDLALVDLIGGDNPRAALLGPLLFVLGAVLGFRESPREARCYRGHGCGGFCIEAVEVRVRSLELGVRSLGFGVLKLEMTVRGRDLVLEKELQASGAFRTSMHGQWLGGS